MNAINPMLHAWQASVAHADAPSIADVRAMRARIANGQRRKL